MMKSLNFAKQVIGNMIKLKLRIYNEMKMSGDATALGDLAAQQYVSLRQKLLKQAEDQAAMSTEIEAALRKKLQTLGIVGHQTAEHLSAFLHQICFSLANAEQDGLQNLLGDMKKQFGFAIEAGDGVHELLGKSGDALSFKLRASMDLLAALQNKVTALTRRFDEARDRIFKHLGKESQVATMTDADLAERTRQLRALVARLNSLEK